MFENVIIVKKPQPVKQFASAVRLIIRCVIEGQNQDVI